MTEQTQRCPSCGEALSVGAERCAVCGASLVALQGPSAVGRGPTPPSAPSAPAAVSPPPSRSGIGAPPPGVPAAPQPYVGGVAPPLHPGPAGDASRPAGPVSFILARRPLTPREERLAHTISEATGAPEAEVAQLFAERGQQTRRVGARVVGVAVSVLVAVTVFGVAIAQCAIDLQRETSTTIEESWEQPNDTTGGIAPVKVTPSVAATAEGRPTAAELVLLRRLLDGLMSVNEDLPDNVTEPMPDEARQATVWGDELQRWKATFDASRDDEKLASAGVAFSRALARWLKNPDNADHYSAYDRTWHRWDRLDDTWESAAD